MFELGDSFPRVLWLYCFVQYGCAACEAARPEIAKLKAKYPLRLVVVELHVDQREWTELLDWSPKYTPGYALVDRSNGEMKVIKKTTGTMTLQELERWIGPENL